LRLDFEKGPIHPSPLGPSILIGEDGEIVRKKARLVAQEFSQVEGLNFGETFALIARLEAIKILLAFAASKGFKLYQIDVKNAFLNGKPSGQFLCLIVMSH
jgi:hypothetical protein